jgi:hypothetical protein
MLYMWSGTGAQATLQDIAPDAWASTKDSYISGVASAANVDAKWVKVTGVSASAPLVVSTQARPLWGTLWELGLARVLLVPGKNHRRFRRAGLHAYSSWGTVARLAQALGAVRLLP